MKPLPAARSGRHAGLLAAALAGFLIASLWPTGPEAAGLFGRGHERAAKAKDEVVAAEFVSQVRQALEERRYVDAGALIDQAGVLKISSPELETLRGYVLLGRGRSEDALAIFRASKPGVERSPEALQGEGLALAQLGRSDEAFAALQGATAKDRKLWRAWNALGREYDLRRDFEKAQSAYNAALAVPGANAAIILNNRGYSHLLQKQMDLASADFVAALAKDPSLSAARTNLRITLAMEGAYSRATATGVGDDRAAVLNNVGLAAAMRGDYLQAEKLLNEAMATKGQYYSRAAENLQLSRDLAARAEEAPPAPDAPH